MYDLAYLPADQIKDEIQTEVDLLKDQWPVSQAVESGQFVSYVRYNYISGLKNEKLTFAHKLYNKNSSKKAK